ncbi:hypothetical protein AMTRI_Chr13g83350 [Amborella trichopoda]
MSTPTNNTPTIVADKPNPPINNLHQFLPHKLTITNYLIWKSQFMPILRRYDLLDYMDGSLHCLAEFIPTENNEDPKMSHTFLNWK